MQEVGKFCELKDHHPEWSSSEGGKRLDVKLTSHFANNTVTLLDFELAENFSKTYKSTAKFNMYPRFENSQFVSASVGAIAALTAFGFYKFVAWYKPYSLHDTQAGLAQTVPTLP